MKIKKLTQKHRTFLKGIANTKLKIDPEKRHVCVSIAVYSINNSEINKFYHWGFDSGIGCRMELKGANPYSKEYPYGYAKMHIPVSEETFAKVIEIIQKEQGGQK